jgi:hypothetical protein
LPYIGSFRPGVQSQENQKQKKKKEEKFDTQSLMVRRQKLSSYILTFVAERHTKWSIKTLEHKIAVI